MKKKLVSIMLVAAMALSVAACGSSKGNSAKTDGTEAMASSVSKTPDNQISINLASEPQSIDPALNSAVDGGCMIVNSFAGLYTYDKDGKLIPQLASDMPEVSDDETVYTVKMIKSQWSNGERWYYDGLTASLLLLRKHVLSFSVSRPKDLESKLTES